MRMPRFSRKLNPQVSSETKDVELIYIQVTEDISCPCLSGLAKIFEDRTNIY